VDPFHNKKMKTNHTTGLLFIAAAFSIAVGMTLAVRTEMAARAGKTRRARDSQVLESLRSMQQDINRYVAARRLFETAGAGRAAELRELLSAALPGTTPEDMREAYRELTEGWVLRRIEMSLKDISLSGVMAFIQEAEQCRPPWQLTRCLIRGGAEPGTGNVDLTFEVIEKP